MGKKRYNSDDQFYKKKLKRFNNKCPEIWFMSIIQKFIVVFFFWLFFSQHFMKCLLVVACLCLIRM